MDKKRLYHIIEWLIALAACVYLVYRLVLFDDYASLWALHCPDACQYGIGGMAMAFFNE